METLTMAEKDLLETYRSMNPTVKQILKAMAHAAHAAQENTRREYELAYQSAGAGLENGAISGR